MIPKVRIYIEDFVNCVQDFPLKFIFRHSVLQTELNLISVISIFSCIIERRLLNFKDAEALQNAHMYLEAAQMRNNLQIFISANNNLTINN